ncbi:solute carrier family 22 member 25-like protein [Leptotrombidium deliense]|uniref:Solute carrier family 22 member 25-like protein n=1 Tax=Leptotrombidium deliense TaxID=299467 RepID=A0A443RZ64_9ACAR|nr:solute carrier family 22 member 25-like protein [Leptotrombidium deliense]
MTRLILVSGLLARIGVSAMLNINGVYSSEIFPTIVRSRLIAARMVFAALGTVISPLLVTYTFLGVNTPLFIFGVAIFFSGLLMFVMPETVGKPLPDTFEDAENLMKGSDSPAKHKNENAAVEDEQIKLNLISNSLKANA